MRKASRSERKQAARIQRRENIKEAMIQGPKKTRRKLSLINIATLFSIMLVFMTMLVLSKSDVLNTSSFAGAKVEKYMLYSSEKAFKTAYEEKLLQQNENYKYDKGIEDVLKSGLEISFKQNSTKKTNSLIGIFQGKDNQIEKVGVIGVYQEDNGHFPLGFKENAVLLTSIVNEISYEDATAYLMSKNIIDNNGSIVLKSVIFEENGKEYIFHVDDTNKFFYTIQVKKALVEN